MGSVKLTKHYVVYGCPSMTTCNWAVCDVCYESSLTSRRPSSVRSPVFVAASGVHDDEFGISKSALDDEVRRSSVAEKQKRVWSGIVPYLKFGVMLISLDWFYIKLTFEFARAVYDRMMIVNQSLVEDLNELNKDHEASNGKAKLDVDIPPIPNLPWFHAVRKWLKKTPEEQTQEETEELNMQYKWNKLLAEFPTYYRMVLTVQEDLLPKYTHKDSKCSRCNVSPIMGKRFILNECKDLSLCEMCKFASDKDGTNGKEMPYHPVGSVLHYWDQIWYVCVVCLSWTLPAQLYSERGRRIWMRVARNYSVFFRIIFGFWTDKATRDFNLFAQFATLEEEQATSSAAHRRALNSVNIQVVESTSKDKSDRMNLVSALVSSRVVLIQLIPGLTLLSTLAVDISSSPILVFNSDLVELLPPFFMTDSVRQARNSLEQMGNDDEPWKVRSMAVYLCVQESRSIQFFLNLCSNLIALGLIFGRGEMVDFIISASILLFVLTSLIQAIYPFILLHKLLFPPTTGAATNKNGEIDRTDRIKSVTEGVALARLYE